MILEELLSALDSLCEAATHWPNNASLEVAASVVASQIVTLVRTDTETPVGD